MIPLWLPLVLAQVHPQWEVSLRTETRARSITPLDFCGNNPGATAGCSGFSGTAAGDLELRPRFSGTLTDGPWSVSGSYVPTVRVREPYVAPRAEQSHRLQLDGAWQRDGEARVFVGEFFDYGVLDLSTLSRTTTALPLEAIQNVGLVQQLTTDTSAGVDWYLTRRLTLTTSAGFQYGGGIDAASVAALPLQWSPRALARLAWLLTPYDTATFTARGDFTRFSTGTKVGTAELFGNWARLLMVGLTVDVTLGGAVLGGRARDLTGVLNETTEVRPMGGAGAALRVPFKQQHFELRLSGLVGPFIDRFLATVYQRVEGNLSLGWGNALGLSASLRGGVADSLPTGTQPQLLIFYGEAGAGYQGAPWWHVDLGGRYSVVELAALAGGSLPASTQTQWVVGLSVTFLALSQPTPAAQ